MTTTHINWTEPLREISREPVGDKWCFHCRKHQPHDAVIMAPVDIRSYYGPNWKYECASCKQDRVDFPGTFSGREFA